MFIKVQAKDKGSFLALCEEFYTSPAVLHPVDVKNFEKVFDDAAGGCPHCDLYLIEHEGNYEGYLFLAFAYSLEVGGLVVLLEDIYIRESLRGKGVGKAAFDFIHTTYPDMKRLRLELVPDNHVAMGLYKKMGLERLDYMQMIKDL